MEIVIVAALVYVLGAFTPAVGRKIKALFVKETSSVKAAVAVDTAKVEAEIAKKV